MFKKIKKLFTFYSNKNILNGSIAIRCKDMNQKRKLDLFLNENKVKNYDLKGGDVNSRLGEYVNRIVKHPIFNELVLLPVTEDWCNRNSVKVYNFKIKEEKCKDLEILNIKDFNFIKSRYVFLNEYKDSIKKIVFNKSCRGNCGSCPYDPYIRKEEYEHLDLCKYAISISKTLLKELYKDNKKIDEQEIKDIRKKEILRKLGIRLEATK